MSCLPIGHLSEPLLQATCLQTPLDTRSLFMSVPLRAHSPSPVAKRSPSLDQCPGSGVPWKAATSVPPPSSLCCSPQAVSQYCCSFRSPPASPSLLPCHTPIQPGPALRQPVAGSSPLDHRQKCFPGFPSPSPCFPGKSQTGILNLDVIKTAREGSLLGTVPFCPL